MSTVDAALAAMDKAEQEARVWVAGAIGRNARWARDRLRLIQRDRATLTNRHMPDADDGRCWLCNEDMPCPDAQAVIKFWAGEDA